MQGIEDEGDSLARTPIITQQFAIMTHLLVSYAMTRTSDATPRGIQCNALHGQMLILADRTIPKEGVMLC